MAKYPGARWRPLPENKTEPRIDPHQVVFHTMVGSLEGSYGWFKRSDVLVESHFGVGWKGDVEQWMDTTRDADAQTGTSRAISIETEDGGDSTKPWTPAQLEALIDLGRWLAKTHDIPLRICRSASDPGFGWHRLHDAWNRQGKSCPGDARVHQLKTLVLPRIFHPAGIRPVPTETEMVLKRGDAGPGVALIQKCLVNEAKLSPGGATKDNPLPRYGVDGDFGAETESAVKDYQRAARLPENGVVDGLTAAFLLRFEGR